MSEFGSERQNAGGARFDGADALNPTLDSFQRVFPRAAVTLYADQDLDFGPGVKVVRVNSPFSRAHQRYGWRSNDYYKGFGLLQSSADIAIAMDSDMQIVSDDFRAILELTSIFGLAVPLNPRLLLRVDGLIGADSTYSAAGDATLGLGMAYNCSPIAFATRHQAARAMLERYCERILQSPGRGPVHVAQASYDVGYQPCVLPPQWCVCSPRDLDSPHLWREAVVLHVGHGDVLPRLRRERLKEKLRRLAKKVRGR